MRKGLPAIALALAVLLGWPAATGAQSGPLDGKTFSGTMTEKGKTKGDVDTFLFKDGKFRSSACDTYGFAEAAYSAATKGGATSFEATTQSPREGTMKWTGTVRGDRIEGTAVWMKKGQADMSYTFQGALKK